MAAWGLESTVHGRNPMVPQMTIEDTLNNDELYILGVYPQWSCCGATILENPPCRNTYTFIRYCTYSNKFQKWLCTASSHLVQAREYHMEIRKARGENTFGKIFTGKMH